MTDNPSGHAVNRFDPTETPESDPVPTGEDVVNRQKKGHETPRRYDEGLERDKEEGTSESACGPSEARSRRARASGGGAPRAVRNADTDKA